MTIDQTILSVRSDCEEMFFTLGLEDIQSGNDLSKKVMRAVYNREIELHRNFINTSMELIRTCRERGWASDYITPLRARINTHIAYIEELNNKIQALVLL